MNEIVSTNDREIKEKILREVSYGIIKKNKIILEQIFNCITPQEGAEILKILNHSQRKQILKLIGEGLNTQIISFLEEPIRSQLIHRIRYNFKINKQTLVHINREELIQRRVFETTKAILEKDSAKIRQIFNHTQPTDAATIIEFLSQKHQNEAIKLLGSTFDPEILTFLDSTICAKIIKSIEDKKLVQLLSELDESDIIEMIDNIEENRRKKIIESISKLVEKDTIKSIKKSLYYHEDTAGWIMTQVASFPSSWTIKNVYQRFCRMENIPSENQIIYIYEDFPDENGKFRATGELLLPELCRLNNNKKTKNDQVGKHVAEISCAVYTNTKIEEVGFFFKKYCVMEIPVLNIKNNKFLGSIRATKAIDILDAASEEEVLSLVGLDEFDFHENTYNTIITRLKWLGIASTATVLSSGVIAHFSELISKNIILASVMQIVPAIGGNSASQVLTITVRALSNREIARSNMSRTIRKEVIAGFGSGLIIGSVIGVCMYSITKNLQVSMILSFSVAVNTSWAGFIGTSIPIFLQKKGMDPALASVFLNITTDIIGLSILLSLAKLFV